MTSAVAADGALAAGVTSAAVVAAPAPSSSCCGPVVAGDDDEDDEDDGEVCTAISWSVLLSMALNALSHSMNRGAEGASRSHVKEGAGSSDARVTQVEGSGVPPLRVPAPRPASPCPLNPNPNNPFAVAAFAAPTYTSDRPSNPIRVSQMHTWPEWASGSGSGSGSAAEAELLWEESLWGSVAQLWGHEGLRAGDTVLNRKYPTALGLLADVKLNVISVRARVSCPESALR